MDTLYDRLKNKLYYMTYNPNFTDFFEMHLADLRAHSYQSNNVFTLTDYQKQRAINNFNLLCNMENIPYDLHWYTLRVNGYVSFDEYTPTPKDLYHVDMVYLEKILYWYNNSQSTT